MSAGARSRSSPVLFVLVAVALAVGAAASLIAGLASSSAFHPGPATELLFPTWLIGAVILLLFAVVVGLIIYVRLAGGSGRMPAHFAMTGMAVLLVMLLFVVLLHFGGASGGFSFGGGVPPTNSTGPSSPPNGNNLTGPGGQITFFSLKLPPWALFAAVAVTLLVVGAVAIPRAYAYAAGRKREGGPGRRASVESEKVRGALATASQQLQLGSDPREVIIALYGTVLDRVGPLVSGIDMKTPEEIRVQHLMQLGIGAAPAESLTRLFEEARYSSHPMGPDAASEAVAAIDEARADLDRLRPAP
jgi:hypothetical protein